MLRRVLLAAGALIAVVIALLPASAHADTIAGSEAADQARAMVARGATLPDPGSDIAMYIAAWSGLGVRQGDWLAAADDPGMTGGVDHRRTDAPAMSLARAVCGRGVTFTWQVTRAEQPARGDLVLYHPAESGDAFRAALHVGIVVSQTQVVVMQLVAGGERPVAVRRELLFHAQQATAGDTRVADGAADVSFCHVADALIPASLRGSAGAGAVRLVDPRQVVDTLAWNSEHPRDRDGGGAMLRMLSVFAFIPGAGVGALAGLLVFGLAAVHDSSDGVMGTITAPFAVVRGALTRSIDGTGIQRALTITLLVLLGFKVAGTSFALGLGVALTAGVTGALQVALDGRVTPFSWLAAIAWTLASYAVGIATGIDSGDHVSVVTVLITAVGGTVMGVGGARLVAMSGSLGVLARTSAVARGVAAVSRGVHVGPAVGRFAASPAGRLVADANATFARFTETVLGRASSMQGVRPSALVPSGMEWVRATARTIGEGVPTEVAPSTVAEAVANARVGVLPDVVPWSALAGDMYGVGLRVFDVASWFTWRPHAWTGDTLSMLGELAEWLAGRLGRSQITHPWVRQLDSLLGHLDPEVRRRVVEVALPGLRDASRLSNLHSGGQLAGKVLTGQLQLPTPPAPAAAATIS